MSIKRKLTFDPKLRKLIEDQFPDEEFMYMDGHDNAIIGITDNSLGSESRHKLIYDHKQVIQNLEDQGSSFEDAVEWYEFNMAGSYMGEHTPVFMLQLDLFGLQCEEAMSNAPRDINEFRGDYRWLSNFAPATVLFRGVQYPSVENAYQSAKIDDTAWSIRCQMCSPAQAKKESREIRGIHPDWDIIKMDVMFYLLVEKYNKEPYKAWLQKTGSVNIVEGNTWGDVFWGVDLKTGEGQNILGRMIMNIRESFRTGKEPVWLPK